MRSFGKFGLAALSGALLLLLLAPGAGAAGHRRKPIRPPAQVRIQRVAVGHTTSGRLALLVAVHYPIEAAGRPMKLAARIAVKRGRPELAAGRAADRVSSGPPRKPERRHAFTFVHAIVLKSQIAALLEADWKEGRSPLATVEAEGGIDIDNDGKPDIRSRRVPRRTLRLTPPRRVTAARAASTTAGKNAYCSSVPVVMVSPGGHAGVPLPSCTRQVGWQVTAKPSEGSARVGGNYLNISAPKEPGTQTIGLDQSTVVVKVVAPWTSSAALGATAEDGPVVRAMGDSVTAGYGYYSDGKEMSILQFLGCKPVGKVLDDACSSNSLVTKSGLSEIEYAPDYGRANDISWAAQWANEYGVTNYKNYAVTGSQPNEWAPGGTFYGTTKKIESEDPDYILMTLGANPILSETLLGLEPMECAIEADILGGYRKCVETAFEKVHLHAELKRVYENLVANTTATIYLMQYHLSVPSSALLYSVPQIAEMAKLMNETIATTAAEVDAGQKTSRLQVVTPPHFDVGVSLEPVEKATFSCSYFEYLVDGPSVQSTLTQDELTITHPLSFCKGPAGGGPPWIISSDTGIHPSAIGYAQMASQVPPPSPSN